MNVTVRLLRASVLLCTALSGPTAVAVEFTGYAVLTTDYVFRGVSYSDSHGAVQLGGEISVDSGFYSGIWGSTVDISGGSGRQRDVELDYYIGYALDVSNKWSVGANVVSYNFPRAEGPFDYDYIEYSLASNYNDRVWFEYSYSPDLYHSHYSAQNFELYTEWPLGGRLLLGAGAGFYDVSNLSKSDYTNWQLGVTRPFGVINVDLRYFDTSDWVPIVSTPDRAEERIVLSVRYQF